MTMPFSKRKPLAKKAVVQKMFIGVYTYTDTTGQTVPSRIRWEDGQEWEVDRLLDVRPAHATRAGGFGTRYLVRIGRHERALFQQDDGRWFVEADK